jgi:tetratricopeptide (TPR) repeat protein
MDLLEQDFERAPMPVASATIARADVSVPAATQAVRTDARGLELNNRLAEIESLLREQSIGRAVEMAKALAAGQGAAAEFLRIGQLLYEYTIFEEAIAVCETGLGRFKDDPGLLGLRGKALLVGGRTEEAVQDLRRAARASNDPEVAELLRSYS